MAKSKEEIEAMMKGIRAQRTQAEQLIKTLEGSISDSQKKATAEAKARMETETGRAALATEFAAVQEKIREYESRNAKLEGDLKALGETRDWLQREKAQVEGVLEVERRAKEEASSAKDELSRSASDLEQKLQALGRKAVEAEQRAATEAGVSAQKSKDLAAQRASFDAKESVYKRQIGELEAQARETTDKLAELNERVEAADAARKESTEAKVALEARLGTEKSRADGLEAERGTYIEARKTAERRTANLERQLGERDAIIAGKEKAYGELNSLYSALEEEKRKLGDELAEKKREYDELLEKNNATDKELKDLRRDYAELAESFEEIAVSHSEIHAQLERLGYGKKEDAPAKAQAPEKKE